MNKYAESTPYSKRYDAVCDRAKNRACRSDAPERFLSEFHEELSALRREGMTTVIERTPDWLDPIHLAAEVEAIAALRAMRYWGTTEGLCLKRSKRNEALAA